VILNMTSRQPKPPIQSRQQIKTGRKSISVARAQPESSIGRSLVALFVIFHLIAIALFSLPVEVLPVAAIRDLIAPYMRCVGLNEMWNTFAPNPKSAEQFLRAVVVTVNGNTEVYSFPRMENLSFFQRYRKERYRKFTESVLCNDCSGLWPDIEKEVARRAMNPTDPPDRIILIDFESPIDPKTGAIGDDANGRPKVLTELSIKPEDLQ
jgi:hypothetical protein